MTSKLTSDERLVKILSETQATIMEHNSRCVRGSVEVDARLFESMIMELQERPQGAMDGGLLRTSINSGLWSITFHRWYGAKDW